MRILVDVRRRATFFAAVACTLFIPTVYDATDPLIGGRNHIGLVFVIAMLISFWQFHTATVLAIFTDRVRRRHHLVRGRWAVAVAATAVVVGFRSSHVDATNHLLPPAHANQPGMQLFLWAGSGFIIWVCGEPAANHLRFLPKVDSPRFKAGFGCFAGGCIFMGLSLANRLTLG
ncbi:hypothetical protein [Arthrobacter sp. A5]|uniref:hypothetical protein n=1 Tax=Arthrobacter sp. A5 TaxID=576926 RepID=UPI003DA895B8